jgi:hypothetical protein
VYDPYTFVNRANIYYIDLHKTYQGIFVLLQSQIELHCKNNIACYRLSK